MNHRAAIDLAGAIELEPAGGSVLARAVAQLALLHQRRALLPFAVVSDVEWAMLLEAFVAEGLGAVLQTRGLETAAGIPPTTMLRYISLLENKQLIVRAPSPTDRRATLVAITARGRRLVASVLENEQTPNTGPSQ